MLNTILTQRRTRANIIEVHKRLATMLFGLLTGAALCIVPSLRASVPKKDARCVRALMDLVSTDFQHSKALNAFSTAMGKNSGATEARHALNSASMNLENELKDHLIQKKPLRLSHFISNTVLPRIKAVKGGHLRRNPVCMRNFAKNLGLAWAFQAFGVASYEWSRKKEGLESKDFPFDVFANTAFLIWIQQEIACAQTSGLSATRVSSTPATMKQWLARARRVDPKAVGSYISESLKRYRELLLTIPVGIASYTAFAMGEDQLRRSLEVHRHGESDRPEVFSADYLDEFASHATFIAGFESVLFARMSFVNTPLELKALPAIQAQLRAKGLGALGQAGEWGLYRIPMGLFDGKVLIWWKNKSAEIFAEVESKAEIESEEVVK